MAGREGSNFGDLHNEARTVWPRMTEIGTIRRVRDKHVSRGLHSPRLLPKGTRRSVREIFVTSYIYAHMIWPRATKCGKIIHVEKYSAFLRGQPRPVQSGRGPSVLQNLRPPRAHNVRNNNQILHGDQTILVRKSFTRSTTDARSVCGS